MPAHVMSISAVDVPLSQLYIHDILSILGIVILYYDHLITFDEEYVRIWKGRRSSASALFLLNRYFAIIGNVTVAAGEFMAFHSIESCSSFSFYRQLALIATQILVGIMQILRTYALYGKSRKILSLMVTVALMLLGLSVWAVTGQKSGISIQNGCHLASTKTSAIHISAAWMALFMFDSMIFSLTLLKTYKERLRYSMTGDLDLISLIVRDGAIYFAVMVFAQGANVITFFVCVDILRGALSTFASAISVTMMSRLMLNLHKSAVRHENVFGTTLGRTDRSISTVQFTTGIGATDSFVSSDNSLSDDDDIPDHVRQAMPAVEVEVADLPSLSSGHTTSQC